VIIKKYGFILKKNSYNLDIFFFYIFNRKRFFFIFLKKTHFSQRKLENEKKTENEKENCIFFFVNKQASNILSSK
jgi:hypothetical protein